MQPSEIMKLAADKARTTMRSGAGGPFGAAVVKDNEVISVESNSVIADNDPTAHAEINAIRSAAKKLGTHDLTGCEIYATGYPCPMCMSAIIWANIRKVHYSGDLGGANSIGFRDDHIYEFISGTGDRNMVEIESVAPEHASELYSEYSKMEGTIY